MTVQNKGFEVKVQLQPTVRQINRAPKRMAPATESVAKRGRFPRITQVLALALQFQEMIDRTEVRSYTDLTRLGCVSRERISQIMMLTWLAPDIQEQILRLPLMPGGRCAVSEAAIRRVARLPLWEDQRAAVESWHLRVHGAQVDVPCPMPAHVKMANSNEIPPGSATRKSIDEGRLLLLLGTR